MALQTSGQISIADINTELGNSSTAQLGLGDSSARDLAGIASGQIAMSNFYGASASLVSFVNAASDGVTATTFVYDNLDIGPAFDGRWLLIAAYNLTISGNGDGTLRVNDGGNIGSLPNANVSDDVSFYKHSLEFFRVSVDSGTTVKIELSHNASVYSHAIGVWAVNGRPDRDDSISRGLTNSEGYGIELRVPTGGFGLFATGALSAEDPTVSGDATKDFGENIEGSTWMGGYTVLEDGFTNTSFDVGTSSTDSVALGVSFTVS